VRPSVRRYEYRGAADITASTRQLRPRIVIPDVDVG